MVQDASIDNLPFQISRENLGQSNPQTLKRFKLAYNEKFKIECVAYNIRDYSNEGRMREFMEEHDEECYYIRHYKAIKRTSSTTKLRVVFDANMETSRLSLNIC